MKLQPLTYSVEFGGGCVLPLGSDLTTKNIRKLIGKAKSIETIHMATVDLDGRILEVDGDGFLADPYCWNEEVARLIAKHDGIVEMSDKHWAIVKFIRQNWEEKGMAPMIRSICQVTGVRLKDIYQLFPLGPARGACRVAGLPKPDGCV